jgi:PST family polysaccharide transporter
MSASDCGSANRINRMQAPVTTAGSSYRQILSSSAWIAGATALNIVIGLVRTKVMAVLLGPMGFGLLGAFNAIADLVRSVAQLGTNSSGVRQIAESNASNDPQRVALTALVLRRTAWGLGVFGAILLVVLAFPVARLTFGDEAQAGAVALLCLAVLFRVVADAQAALVQGMRRVADVAKINVLGAVLGTAASLPLIYWLRQDGAAWAVVAIAAGTAAASWWYSRKIRTAPGTLQPGAVWNETSALLRLGAAFMASALLMMGAAYLVRLILIRSSGLEAAGLFQAAWTLGGLYVGFVLQAMGTDFYPRLVGSIKVHGAVNRLVNEQAHVSLLLAGTGVLGTVALSPFALLLLYSTEFEAAAPTLRWICLGMALRVISWPMGYIILARGDQGVFFATELAWAVVNVGSSWLLVRWYGLEGAGMAFLMSYVFHVVMIYTVVRARFSFRMSRGNLWRGILFILSAGAAFALFAFVPMTYASLAGSVAAAVAGWYAFTKLRVLAAQDSLPCNLHHPLRGGSTRQ